jgi:hypothetical protein
MNYPYAPSMFGGPQILPQPVFVPQGVIGSQLGQLAGGFGGHLLPGPFGAIASQLLPQLGTLLPFQAGPQQVGLAIPHSSGLPTPYPGLIPQGVIGSQLGQFAGGIVGHFVPGPFGPAVNQWLPQFGGLLPFQAGPQASPYYGGIPNHWAQQLGNVYPYQAGPQQFSPMGVPGMNIPYFNSGVSW